MMKKEIKIQEDETLSFAISAPYDFRVLKDGTLIVNYWKSQKLVKNWRFKLV